MSTFRKRLFLEKVQTIQKYYSSPRFALIDLLYGFFSLFSNPYRTCRKFLEKKGEAKVHLYGETPLTTYEKIAKEVGLGSQDVWVELGAGRGKGAFWLAHFIKCQVIAIEQVPQFVGQARFIQKLTKFPKIDFQKKDIAQADLSKATIVYLYGIWPNFSLPSHVRVITISEPLEGWEVEKSFWVRFAWGRTRAFLQKKKKNG